MTVNYLDKLKLSARSLRNAPLLNGSDRVLKLFRCLEGFVFCVVGGFDRLLVHMLTEVCIVIVSNLQWILRCGKLENVESLRENWVISWAV